MSHGWVKHQTTPKASSCHASGFASAENLAYVLPVNGSLRKLIMLTADIKVLPIISHSPFSRPHFTSSFHVLISRSNMRASLFILLFLQNIHTIFAVSRRSPLEALPSPPGPYPVKIHSNVELVDYHRLETLAPSGSAPQPRRIITSIFQPLTHLV